ncbi:hypothetical protein L3Q82_023447 [Scortum barcoo]|uniref:Uncharacterized protein n=1 Tax=Scortum barcoo TaxID=214431 RepID=A0ACB8X237_9TELE|nr:hypothetical protein L3Q82_023447 [Scortum barcoo]
MTCFGCGEEGHTVRACPVRAEPVPPGPGPGGRLAAVTARSARLSAGPRPGCPLGAGDARMASGKGLPAAGSPLGVSAAAGPLGRKAPRHAAKACRAAAVCLCRYTGVMGTSLIQHLQHALRQLVHTHGLVVDVWRRMHAQTPDSTHGPTLERVGSPQPDQEKAFDRVEHNFLWKVMESFGFSAGFIAKIKVLYSDIESVLKINGSLCAPFRVHRGVRQGCALSGDALCTLSGTPVEQNTFQYSRTTFTWF